MMKKMSRLLGSLLPAAFGFAAGCAVMLGLLFCFGRGASEGREASSEGSAVSTACVPPRLELEPPVRASREASEEVRPSVRFLSRGTYLALSDGQLAYETQALERVTFVVSRAYENNVVPLGWSWKGTDLMKEVARKTVAIDAPKAAKAEGLLDVAALVNHRPGLYEVRTESEAWWETSCIVVLTDLGVSYGFDKRFNGFVAVRSLSQHTPAAGAAVEAISASNQVLLKGTTDAEGLAHLTPVANAPLAEGVEKLLVRSGDDFSYVEVDDGKHWTGALTGDSPEARALVWTDRGAVRPGETVSLMAMARDAQLQPLAAVPVTLEVRTPSRDVLARMPVTTDSEGVAMGELTLASDAVSGMYLVWVRLGETVIGHEAFYVADFVPDRIQVKVAFETADTVRVSAETYYGTPVREAEGTVRLFAEPAPLPERWRDWTVGVLNAKARVLTAKAIEAEDTLDFSLDNEDFHAPVRLRAIATLSEPNGRAATASAEVMRFTKPAYLGLKETAQGPVMTLLTPEGSQATEATAACIVERLEWQYTLVETADGSYRQAWSEQILPLDMLPLEVPVRTGEAVAPTFGDLYPGRYRLTAKLADGTTSQMDFWCDAGETGVRSTNPSVLTFRTDREDYLPGETAELSFAVPGKGTLLVMEGDAGSLATARALATEGGQVTLPIAVPATHLSGSWRVAVTFLPEKLETLGRSFGLATLKVRQEGAHQLKVALDAPEIVTPGSEVTVQVRLTTPQGEPVSGEVLFFAVDERVLAMSRYETPEPFAFFYGEQPANLLLGDVYGLLYPHLKIGADGRIGGDAGAEVPAMTERVALARVVLPPQTGSDRYTVRFRVPGELQGAMRLMAVATQANRVGSADRRLIVRPSVVLQGEAPRVVCEGDVFSVSLKVENLDLPEGAYTLTVTDGPTFTGTLANGDAVTQTFELSARERIEAQVTMGDFTRSLTLPMTVRPAIPEVTSTSFEVLSEGEAPAGAEVVDAQAVAQTALEWLARYPYTCTEQLVAIGLPYLFREEALAKRQVAYVKGHLLARKRASGGFPVWPSGDNADTDATLLAACFLAQEGSLPWATQRLLRNVAELRETRARGMAAFATWVLAQVDDENAIQFAEDLINAEDGDDAAFLSALALIKLGYAKEGGEIALEFLRSGKRPSPMLETVENAQAALSRSIFLAVRSGLAAEIPADWLAALVTGQQNTTQVCAWTACALEALGQQTDLKLVKRTATSASVRPGQPIAVTREVVDREGKAIATLKHGELAWVKVTLELPRTVEALAVRDLLPGGLEYEDANLATRESVAWPEWADFVTGFEEIQKLPGEVRFFGRVNAGKTVVAYPVRAVNSGMYRMPATLVEDMYDPEMTGACAPEKPLTITP